MYYAEKYGEHAALDWFHKTGAKLGELEDATLLGASGGDVSVNGLRAGRQVSMQQQRILKASPKGKLFHQFPARIYVDGKFTPEADYIRMFA